MAVAADVVRLLAVVSVVAGTWRSGVVGAALFLLVLGGCVLPLALRLPAGLDAAYCATLLFAAWAAQLDWYVAIPGLDVVVHAVATGLIAVVATVALARWGAVVAPTGRARVGVAVVVVGIGAVASVLWELGEWAGHTFLDDRIQVGYSDTLGDLAAGVAGSVIAAALATRSLDLDAAGES
ncbi:hypothetical protein [Cellulomonas edaphi]|uniref:DUF2238 domain-containing protein n=1 Tax=Cellulomonas edaphi TaxID=3053468 RepID=A0ABT7S780_9CELL|nr:hypothetical protein [Cellulomons edaphi]MDM7831456.1 hypothetical protein [Cellulomons edaphi]